MEQLKLGIEKRKLFEQIIAEDELFRAFRAVKVNKGAPGVDGITVEDFGENLQEELKFFLRFHDEPYTDPYVRFWERSITHKYQR